MAFSTRQGNYEKMGVCIAGDEVTFTFDCRNQKDAAIFLYRRTSGRRQTIKVPPEYRIGSVYSITVSGISLEDYDYNFLIGDRVVNDPYANCIVGREIWADEHRLEKKYLSKSRYRCARYDWVGDVRPQLSDEEMILYKLHVRCFTKRGKAKGANKGTFAGVQEAIPYLKELGVTAVELMPVYDFEELMKPEPKSALLNYVQWMADRKSETPADKKEKTPVKLNVWGYKDANYFAPKASYAAGEDADRELKDLIRALHKEHMECILEYYFPEGHTASYIVEVLRHGVRDYHIDGFHLLGADIPISEILIDPLLSDTKIFYTGFTQEFISGNKEKNRLFVYNDEYLYPARKMLNRMEMNLDEMVHQIVKSHPAQGFVNYITTNNGFTLNDLFSYSEKHNEANGEGNVDGSNWNYSANYGEEGKSRRKAVLNDRTRQLRNAFTLLLLSKGVPLIYEGDEVANTKEGNNNTYCQDNNLSYVEWSSRKRDLALFEFVRKMIAFRKKHPVLTDRNVSGHSVRPESGLPEISYHGENAWMSGPEYGRCAIGILYCGEYIIDEKGKTDDLIYVAYNFMGGQQSLALPKLPFEGYWMKTVDTAVLEEPFLSKPERTRDQKVMLPGRSVRIYVAQRAPVKKGKKA